MGIAIEEWILQDIQKNGMAVEYVSARPTNVLKFKDTIMGVYIMVVHTPTDSDKPSMTMSFCLVTLGSTVVKVPT